MLSNYFNSLLRGTKRFDIEPLEYELELVEEPPPLPEDSVRVVKSPSITCYSRCGEVYFTSKDGSIILLHPASRNIKGFLRREILEDSSELFSLICAPFVEVLKNHGLYSLHSAAVYSKGRGYLISGNSGSGKTTSTLSLVTQGFKYVSDDFILLEEMSGEIIVHSLYRTFNLDQELTERIPDIASAKNLSIPQYSKVSVDVSDFFSDSFIPRVRPDVIIFPRIIPNAKSRICPLNKKEAFTRLLKHIVLAVDREASKKQLSTLEKLVKQTDSFELLSGRDVHQEPKDLLDIINQANLKNTNSNFLPSLTRNNILNNEGDPLGR